MINSSGTTERLNTHRPGTQRMLVERCAGHHRYKVGEQELIIGAEVFRCAACRMVSGYVYEYTSQRVKAKQRASVNVPQDRHQT